MRPLYLSKKHCRLRNSDFWLLQSDFVLSICDETQHLLELNSIMTTANILCWALKTLKTKKVAKNPSNFVVYGDINIEKLFLTFVAFTWEMIIYEKNKDTELFWRLFSLDHMIHQLTYLCVDSIYRSFSMLFQVYTAKHELNAKSKVFISKSCLYCNW